MIKQRNVFLVLTPTGKPTHENTAQHDYPHECSLLSRCFTHSQSTIPAATEILNECFIPSCGISIHPSQTVITSVATPSTSLPKTSAIGSVKFELKLESEMLPWACSTA
jgi:hypothetical protein